MPAESRFESYNVGISIDLTRIELTNTDINLISGALLNYFTPTYDVTRSNLKFEQHTIIPANWTGFVTIPITVTQNSTNSTNGFLANVHALDVNTQAPGYADGFTYTDSSVPPITCAYIDSLALVALYNSTNGANWTTPWDLSQPIDIWYGITTNADGCVTEIDLQSNQLVGAIPTEIGNFEHLESLDLHLNRLLGTIPTEIGNLTNLVSLNLRSNQLSGIIPTEIGNLIKLGNLWLHDNQFLGNIPTEIGNLINLSGLGFHENQLSGSIPTEIGNLTNLVTLNLRSNQLSDAIPTEIGNLTNLVWLHLNNNQLTGSIPTETGNLIKLDRLYLNDNQLSGAIPTEIGNLTNLVWLYLNNNQLSNAIPIEIGNLTNLAWLDLSQNQLSSAIPTEIGNLTELGNLWLNDNQLSGAIPTEIGNLTKLFRLYLNDNQLSGTIPEEIGNLTNLIELYFSNNQLIGCFPSTLTTFCGIGYDFSNNPNLPGGGDFDAFCMNGTGGCPPITCAETDSLALVALYNSTDGANWTTTWDLSQPMNTWHGITTNADGCVTKIDLYNNQLTGTIPIEIGNLTNLIQLDLYINQLTGTIPVEIGKLTNLVSLSLRNNQLTGAIPAEIGNLINLSGLYLQHNQLSGNIPPEIGNLINLIDGLYLQTNQLSGNIPAEIGNLINLIQLYLTNNQLSGNLPTQLGNLENLRVFHLANNQLSGVIPTQLGSLENLRTFVLGHNELSGNIPAEIGNLTNLANLQLNNNQLSGCFPSTLTTFCGINYDFSNNPSLPGEGDFADFCNNGTGGCNTCTYTDSLALVALYNSTNGASWTTTWDLSQPIDTWYGITTNVDGCVTAIDLHDNQLTGTMPPELGNFELLDTLDLSHNQLSDTIPAEIGNLTNLIDLQLYENQLTGIIPAEIGKLSNLKYLVLLNNQLSGSIPHEIGKLTNLRILYLHQNQLTGIIPAEIGDLSNLNYFWLNDNQLSGSIPPQIGKLSNLQDLRLYNNQLTGSIPPQMGNLNVGTIYLMNNQLSGCFPQSLTNFCDIPEGYKGFGGNPDLSGGGDFDAFCDNGTGACIISCAETDSLALVALYNSADGANWTTPWDLLQPMNIWFGITTNADGCVTEINLGENELTGTMSPQLSDLGSLETLHLFNNQLSGNIPVEVGNLINLKSLWLDRNQLTGIIPTQIGNLTNLTDLRLYANQLTGAIPTQIENLTKLHSLLLSHNQLIGEIPTQIGNLANLMGLFLNDNQLVGVIPTQIGNLTKLTALRLYNNELTGAIPTQIGNLTKLITLQLGSNQLTGAIPTQIGSLTKLLHLQLGSNQLTGGIPSSLGNLTNLIALHLHNNQLIGCFPSTLTTFCEIDYNFSNNPNLPGGGDFANFCANGIGECTETAFDSLGGEYFRKQIIVQLDTIDFPFHERQALRDSFQATVLDTCLCGDLELWELPDDLVINGVPVIHIDDRVRAIRKKTKAEDGGANYVINFADYTADKFQDTNGFTDNGLVADINTAVRIAVLDSGVDPLESFSGLFWQNPLNTGWDDENCINDPAGFDFVHNSPVTLDTVGHGTAVTGRIVNAHQGGLVDDPTEFDQTILDNLEIVNAKVYAGDRGSLWDLLCGLYYARNADVDIVNCSMGYSGEESSILKTAIQALQDSCVLVVASAGNDSLNNDEIPHWPSGFDMNNIVSVGAINGFNSTKLSAYSNFGEESVHIAYPGTIGALQPGDSIHFKKGTSYSAAAVTGIAARLKMHQPAASYLDLRNALLGGVRIPSPRLNVSTGGILDYPTALEVLNTQIASPCICVPIVACKDISLDFSTVQNQEIEASIFNNGSYSNCASGTLIYSFTSDTQQSQTMAISCTDISTQTLNFYVTDEGGNQDFCQVTLKVTDTNSVCNDLNGCENDGSLHITGSMDSGDYKAKNVLTSDGKIYSGTMVNFISEGSIALLPGFEAQANSSFLAKVDDIACNDLIEELPNTSRNQLPDALLESAIKIQVMPNPFSGRTTIQYELSAATTQLYMAIFDISGKKLKELHPANFVEKGIHTIELDASSWQKGMYFLGIRTENQTITKKLVLLNH